MSRLVSPDTAAVSDANSAGRPSPTRPRTDAVRVSGQFVPLLGCSASQISFRRLIATARCAGVSSAHDQHLSRADVLPDVLPICRFTLRLSGIFSAAHADE